MAEMDPQGQTEVGPEGVQLAGPIRIFTTIAVPIDLWTTDKGWWMHSQNLGKIPMHTHGLLVFGGFAARHAK